MKSSQNRTDTVDQPPTLDAVAGRSADLIGLGTDIGALIPHLAHAEVAMRAWVDEPDQLSPSEAELCARLSIPVLAVAEWTPGSALAIRAPGFPRYRPAISAIRTTTPMTTPIALWLNTYGAQRRTIVVTGTKGKSTVTTMLAAILSDSVPVGNIGVPIWSVGETSPDAVIICEVSSYQGAETDAATDLAILTSLSEDHITWHGSVKRYRADKLQPVHRARRVLTHSDLAEWVKDSAGEVRLLPPKPDPSQALEDGIGVRMPAHVDRNARLAIAAADWLATDFPSVQIVSNPDEVIRTLEPLPGRLRPIPSTVDEHHWYDDALASNPTGAAAAVDAFAGHPIFLIVGGTDREVSLEPLVDSIEHALARSKPVFLCALPDNGEAIAAQITASCSDDVQVFTAATVTEAVEVARVYCDKETVVLFSPAAPTPTRFGTWEDRSRAFDKAVRSGQPLS